MKKTLTSTVFIFLLSIFASQCFSQSSSQTATPTQDQYAQNIEQLFFYIQNYYVDDVDPQKLYEGAIRGMLDSLDDPHSTYLDKNAWRSMTDITVGNFGGVGLSITKEAVSTPEKPAYVKVASPIDNSPGYKAGIKSGDLIVAIEGVDTSTITMEEVLGKLRGTVGESVTITIRRKGRQDFDVTLVRAIIENPTVKFTMIGSTGYIQLTEFGAKSSLKFQEALDSFKAQNYKGLIIDLRNNGGGLLSAAVQIADMFMDEGLIVSTKSRLSFENTAYYAQRKNTIVKNLPVVILVNGNSASASEVLTAALKDSKKAYVVGTKTYGKGSVQIPRQLLNNDGFKITVAKHYSPDDVNIDKVGIMPDQEVKFNELTDDEAKTLESLLDSKVIEDYVYNNEDMTETQIADYAEILYKKYKLEKSLLRKLIRNETDKVKPSRLYDLDYDVQLNAALKVINDGNFNQLMEKTVSLKQAEEKRKAEESNKALEK